MLNIKITDENDNEVNHEKSIATVVISCQKNDEGIVVNRSLDGERTLIVAGIASVLEEIFKSTSTGDKKHLYTFFLRRISEWMPEQVGSFSNTEENKEEEASE